MSHPEIPVGSRWRDRFGCAYDVERVAEGCVFTRETLGHSGVDWWLANMRRIDTPAAPVVRVPKVGETWKFSDNGVHLTLVHSFVIVGVGPDSATVKGDCCWDSDANPKILQHTHNLEELRREAEYVSGPPVATPATDDVCGFWGCPNRQAESTVHTECYEGCACKGKGDVNFCHDFVPQAKDIPAPRITQSAVNDELKRRTPTVSKTETPAPLRHDWSNPYLFAPGLNPCDKKQLCAACGVKKTWDADTLVCWPRPGWREQLEARIPATINFPAKPPARHHYQAPLSAGLALGGGAVRCGCAKCAVRR